MKIEEIEMKVKDGTDYITIKWVAQDIVITHTCPEQPIFIDIKTMSIIMDIEQTLRKHKKGV